MVDTDVINPTEPFRMATPEGMDAWRKETPASPAIADLAPAEDKSMSGLVSSLTNLQRQKVQSDTKLSAESDAQQAKDKTARDRAFAQEGVAAAELPKPWDAEKEHKRWESDPIEGFGSAGGLFAMVASAFTKAPMENAINGMAGAINSIKEGNEKGYERAYDAFKTNVKLADQRFKTQHELYSDALSLGTADAAASDAKLRNAATKFGDSQMLMLAEHGMIKEVYELQTARAQAHEQMMKAADATDLHAVQKAAVNAIKQNPPNTGDPVQDKLELAARIQNVFDGGGKYGGAEQAAVGKYMQSHMKDSADVIADGLAEIHQKFSVKAPNIEAYQAAKQAYRDANNGAEPPPDEDAKMLQMYGLTLQRGGAGGTSVLTNDRVINRDAEEHKQRMHQEHPDWSPEKLDQDRDAYVKQRQLATKAPTAHDIHSDDIAVQKAERMETAMDEMESMLLKHKAITGIGGTLTRPVEAISNILGSNETDRKQFQRVATELKEWGQSVVNDRTGRPLSSEAKDASVIFAGLNPGDTSANTVRAITELRPVIKRIKEQIKARGQGKGPVSGGEESPPAAKEESAKDQPWLRDPVKP